SSGVLGVIPGRYAFILINCLAHASAHIEEQNDAARAGIESDAPNGCLGAFNAHILRSEILNDLPGLIHNDERYGAYLVVLRQCGYRNDAGRQKCTNDDYRETFHLLDRRHNLLPLNISNSISISNVLGAHGSARRWVFISFELWRSRLLR